MHLKRIRNILLVILAILFVVLASASFFLSLSSTQTKLGTYLSKKLRDDFDVDIRVKQIDLSYLGQVQLKEILIKDHHQDTLIASNYLKTSILTVKEIFENKMDLGKVTLKESVFRLKTYKDESATNLTVFSEKFTKNKKKSATPFILNTSKIIVEDIDFSIVNENLVKNKNIASYTNISGTVLDFQLNGPNVKANLQGMQFIDNHGLDVKNLTTQFSYSLTQMVFDNLVLETKKSSIKANMTFDYSIHDLADFNNKVYIKAKIENSYLSLVDLKKIYVEFGENDVFQFSTSFKGTLNNFKVNNFKLDSGRDFVVRGDYAFKNSFSNTSQFSMEGKTYNLSSNYQQLKNLLPNLLGKFLPSELSKLGLFKVKGYTKISSENIAANINLQSEIGDIVTDLQISNIDNIDFASYSGHMKISDFKLGEIVKDPNLGLFSFEGDVLGSGFNADNINTSLKGIITKHQYNNYTYSNINVDGLYQKKQFNGHLNVNDKNIKMNFLGLADLSSEVHKFNFTAQVDFANFNKLNLFKRDSIAVLKGGIFMNFMGNSLDEIKGEINFKNASYTNQIKKYDFDDFKIKSVETDGVKTISILSNDIANGQIKGKFKISEIDKLFRNSMGSMLSNYRPLPVETGQFFEFDFKIHSAIVEVFFPKIQLSSNTLIKGKIIDAKNEIKLLVQAPRLGIYESVIDSLSLQIDNKNPVLNTNFKIKKIQTKNYEVHNVNFLNKTLNDTLFFRTDFTGGKAHTERFDMTMYYTIDKNNNSIVGIQKSKVHFKNKDWFVNENNNKHNKVVFNLTDQVYKFDDLSFSSGEREIKFNGSVKDSTYKDLKILFNKVRLSDVVPEIDSLSLKGLMNGVINFKQEKGVYQPYGHVRIDQFMINNSLQGDLDMQLKAEDSYKKYKVDIVLDSQNLNSLEAKGLVDLSPKIPTIDLNVELDDFKLNAFSPLGKNVLSKIRGVANGSFKVNGALNSPNIVGEISLENAGLSFPYLNVDYDFLDNPKIILESKSFVFQGVNLKDTKYGTKGFLKGKINHNSFKNWVLDLTIDSNRLLILDTHDGDNVLYYGTGFIEGNASIKGRTSDLRIDVKAKTLEGTKFVIPLNDVKGVENSSLIHFKTKDKVIEIDPILDRKSILENIQGLSLNFDIEVTKEAEAQIVIDRVSGSSLKGNGSGNLLIEIDTKGKFNMFGDYLIDKGTYNFIYGGLINKPFEVRKGGTISWDGDPFEANLNIEAVHRVKANPKALLDNISTNRKIEIDLETKIRGKLFSSTNEFDIVIPNSSSVVSSELNFKLNENDDNSKMRQFFSLLISKSFFNENNFAANGNSAITGTTSDVIFGALSDVFNKNGDKFQIGLGYTSGEKNDVQNLNIDNQVDISLATQINERILINGKLGVPVGTRTQSSVVGEVKVEILVDEQGNLRWTIFNRQNEIQYSEEEEGYTQGIGLTYQLDFDNVTEMLTKFGLRKNKLLKNNREALLKSKDLIFVIPPIF